MQSSLRFGNLSRISGRTLRVRLMSVTDNTSAADHARYRETKIGIKLLKSAAKGNFFRIPRPGKLSPRKSQ